MSNRFTELLKGSAPPVRGPGEYRRLNRATLRNLIHRDEMRAHRRQVRNARLLFAACLVGVTLGAAHWNPLGSDDWELDSALERNPVTGEPITMHTDPVSGLTFNKEGSEQAVMDFQQALAARDGEVTRITGLAYLGGTSWLVYRLASVDGEMTEIPDIDLPPELPASELLNYHHFLKTYYRDLLVHGRLSPPDGFFVKKVYGDEFTFRTWSKTYPGYGEVTLYRGIPSKTN